MWVHSWLTSPPLRHNKKQIPEICKQLLPANGTDLFISRACPPALGCYSLGAALYEINPEAKEANGLAKVTRTWTRDDVSCGTTIPLISKVRPSRTRHTSTRHSYRGHQSID